MVAAAAGLPDLVPVPLVRGAVSGDLGHAPTADGVDDTCVIMAVIRVVTSGECSCFRCLASLDRLDGRSPRVLVRPAPAWLLLPSSAADTGGSAAAGLDPKRLKINMSKVAFRLRIGGCGLLICMRNWCLYPTNVGSGCLLPPGSGVFGDLWSPKTRGARCLLYPTMKHHRYNCTRPGPPGVFLANCSLEKASGHRPHRRSFKLTIGMSPF